MIDRQQFVEELKLREQIRRAIKIIREKILERKGYEEVFHSDGTDDQASLEAIKASVETRQRYG